MTDALRTTYDSLMEAYARRPSVIAAREAEEKAETYAAQFPEGQRNIPCEACGGTGLIESGQIPTTICATCSGSGEIANVLWHPDEGPFMYGDINNPNGFFRG